MIKNAITFFIMVFIFSCNNQPTENKKIEEADSPRKDSVLNCYHYIHNRDTIILKIINVKEFITGTLVYNIYEKDKNQGTIQGKMVNDILIADYTFNAEGMESVRQVAFKKTGDKFIEGFGEVTDKNGKMVFNNVDSLSFNNSITLDYFNCE